MRYSILLTVMSITGQCYALPFIEETDKISVKRQNLNSGNRMGFPVGPFAVF